MQILSDFDLIYLFFFWNMRIFYIYLREIVLRANIWIDDDS